MARHPKRSEAWINMLRFNLERSLKLSGFACLDADSWFRGPGSETHPSLKGTGHKWCRTKDSTHVYFRDDHILIVEEFQGQEERKLTEYSYTESDWYDAANKINSK